MSQDRREFFRSLIAGGTVMRERPQRRNARAHHADQRIYHGPMAIPPHVAAILVEHPGLVLTTSGRHPAMRYVDSGTVYLLRSRVPDHRGMVGEIVRTQAGTIRVHCWSAADPGEYREPSAIVERKTAPQPIISGSPVPAGIEWDADTLDLPEYTD